MANLVLMPQVGVSDESALLAQWHVSVGDTVKTGQLIFTLETDKSTFEIEAEIEGVVLALLCEEGDEKIIAEPVCVIGQPGESWQLSEEGQKAAARSTASASTPVPAISGISTPLSELASGAKRGISPRAKMTAERMGAEPSDASPTGPEGRIIERDIHALEGRNAASSEVKPAAQNAASGAAYEDVPHSRIRKVIAANMLASLQTLAQLTHHHSFDATALLALRARCKDSENERLKGITIGDLVLFAAARTLRGHPKLNAHYNDDFLRVFAHVDIGVAVDTPRGLMVPTIRNAELLSAAELSFEVKRASEDCRKGSVDPKRLTGATFTVSNLGALGVELFTPIINPPQVAVLGVCGLTHRVRVDGRVYPAMGLSLTYDHRAVDGAPASRFMQDLCKNLEGIELLCLI